MPKHKSKKAADTSDSDSGPDDRGPVASKKPKFAKDAPSKKKDNEDELSWDLGKNRFVKLSEFKGKWYVNLREFYESDGELRPTKKGIMLTMEQWQKFKSHFDDIEEAIKKNI